MSYQEIQETPPSSRPMSWLDRWYVCARNTELPSILSVAVTYPTDRLPSLSTLSQRIKELQEHFPELSSIVEDARTPTPRFVYADMPASDILREVSLEGTTPESSSPALKLIQSEIARLSKPNGRLWSVALFKSSNGPESYLLLTMDHLLADGRGFFNILTALLADSIDDLPYEKLETVRKLEVTIPCQPSYYTMASMIFRLLLLPRMPVFVQNWFKIAQPWPNDQKCLPVTECVEDHMLLTLSMSEMDALVAIGKAKGIKTFHPLLVAIIYTSLWSAIKPDDPSNTFLQASIPRSERKPNELGHPYCTGNYASINHYPLHLNSSTDFWELAKDYATYLLSPRSLKDARVQGMFAYIPNKTRVNAPTDPRKPTGWEETFLNRLESSSPYRASMIISNIGRIGLPRDASDMFWSATLSPGSAIRFHIVGHEGGLRITVAWHEGSAVARPQIEELSLTLHRVVDQLIKGGSGSSLGEMITPA